MVNYVPIKSYENLPIGVYTCDHEGYLTWCNELAVTLWGRRPEIGTERWSGAFKIFKEDNSELSPHNHPVAIAVREKKIISNAEYVIERPDGKKRDVLLSSIPTFNDSGEFTGTINTLFDITDQKAGEARQAMMASIIESSEDAIISKSLEGKILSWNKAAERMFGHTEEEAIGKHISLIIPHEKLYEETFIINKIKSGKRVEHFETFRMRKDGSQIAILLTVSPIRNSKGIIIGASKIARDITRQKYADAQLKHYASKLEEEVEARTNILTDTVITLEETQANLNEALANEKKLGQLKSRFVSMASHEFRTPLSSIKLSCSLVEKYTQTSDIININKHVIKIKSAVDNLTNILNDFLCLEKLEAGKVAADFYELDIVKLSEEIKDEMQLMSRPGQQIIYQHKGTTNLVILDQNLLRNCIINLLSNAIKYSLEDSIIELDTEVTEDQILISVNDHGIGIPINEQLHLFEAFFRANNTGTIQGTGLGLNIVSRYAGLMNGKISFKSSLGIGSSFTLKFPRII